MLSKFIFLFFFISYAIGQDSFLESTVAKLSAQASQIKTLSFDLVQSVEYNGHSQSTSSQVFYKNSDREYSRSSVANASMQSETIQRGDSLFVSFNGSPFQGDLSSNPKSINPLNTLLQTLEQSNLQFVASDTLIRQYKSYVEEQELQFYFDANSGELLKQTMNINGETFEVAYKYQKVKSIVLPFSIIVLPISKSGMTSSTTFKNIRLNRTLASSLFKVP